MKNKFKQNMAVVFDPKFKVDDRHPLKKREVVYYLGDIPNVPGHCIVATFDGKVVPMIHPGDLREALEDEL